MNNQHPCISGKRYGTISVAGRGGPEAYRSAAEESEMVNTRNDPAPAQDAHDAAAHRRRWLDENVAAFAAQARWHERHDHPLADILMGPAQDLLLVPRPVPGRGCSQA